MVAPHEVPDLVARTHDLRRAVGALFVLLSTGWSLGLGGCSLAVDTDHLTAGDAGLDCTTSEKVCPMSLEDPDGPSECADGTSPENGCMTSACRPCEVPGAVARCTSLGACGIAICEPGFDDCDGDEENGCEIHLDSDEANCGACDRLCSLDQAIATCVQGRCEFVVCVPGYGDCDEDPKNGCEQDLETSNDHCGDCNKPCAKGCIAGECVAEAAR